MSALVYALALFGCSDDATFCERLSDKAQTFESKVQCDMEMATSFESNDAVLRADYPTVIGKCMEMSHWAKLGDKPVDLSARTVRLASLKPRTES